MSNSANSEQPAPGAKPDYIRRKLAGEYLRSRYGFSSPADLAKRASAGDGPEFLKLAPRLVVYSTEALDAWAQSRIRAATPSTAKKAA